jgi:Cu(I)/Ag(I) efflux system membrane protein CusA/SilA
MELTGIKTPLGLKVQGLTVDGIEQLASKMRIVLSSMPQVRSIFAERISQGFYVNVEVNRADAARYGLSVADVQTAVSSGIGGQNIAENIEGRERYPINVRYSQDFRDSVQRMRSVLIATPSGAQIPLGQVAQVSFSQGSAMIRDEDGQLTGYVYIDLKTTDYETL